eukprot:2269519-Rhodomonas_salina.1
MGIESMQTDGAGGARGGGGEAAPIALRVRYAMSGTIIRVRYAMSGTIIRVRYAMSGTNIRMRYAMSGTNIRMRYAMSGTNIAYAATTPRMRYAI